MIFSITDNLSLSYGHSRSKTMPPQLNSPALVRKATKINLHRMKNAKVTAEHAMKVRWQRLHPDAKFKTAVHQSILKSTLELAP